MKKCLPNYFGNHFAVEGILEPFRDTVTLFRAFSNLIFIAVRYSILLLLEHSYHRGQKRYLPNSYSRRFLGGNFVRFVSKKEKV